MARRRLMTMLAALVAVTGLHGAPAAAQSLQVPGVGGVSLDDGLEVELDAQVGDEVELGPKLGVETEDGAPKLEVDGKVKVGGTEVDLAEAPAPTPSPSPSPSPEPSAPPSADDRSDERSAPSPRPAPTPDDEVEAAGGSVTWTPRRQAQFEASRALRDHDIAFGASSSSAVPGVELAPRRPADDAVTDLVYDVPEVAPGVAVASPAESSTGATLVAAPVGAPARDVPLPLQVLTGVLIAGTAVAWNLTRRELGWAFSGLRERA